MASHQNILDYRMKVVEMMEQTDSAGREQIMYRDSPERKNDLKYLAGKNRMTLQKFLREAVERYERELNDLERDIGAVGTVRVSVDREILPVIEGVLGILCAPADEFDSLSAKHIKAIAAHYMNRRKQTKLKKPKS
jgi:hypothetical protein